MTNVVLLTLDAFRSDLLTTETTPFLSELAADAIEYTTAIVAGPGTSSSFPGILASALPLDHGYAALRGSHTPIAEHLPSSVSTVGISSSAPTSRLYNYDRGFSTWTDNTETIQQSGAMNFIKRHERLYQAGKRVMQLRRRLSSSSGRNAAPYMPATDVTDTAISTLEQSQDRSTFMWAHYMDTHTPYHPPAKFAPDIDIGQSSINAIVEEYTKNKPPVNNQPRDGPFYRLSDTELNAIRAYYHAEAAYIDSEIRRLFQYFDSIWREYTVIITADHGEEFMEHGHFGHQPKLYEELIHVPLVIYHSDGQSRTVKRPVSLLDIAPTVCEWFGIDPHPSWRGTSLLTPQKDVTREIRSELSHTASDALGGAVDPEKSLLAVRKNKWKYIYNCQASSRELYDLKADPNETENIREEHSGIATELNAICEDRLQNIASEDSGIEVSEDVNDRLEDLGYLDR